MGDDNTFRLAILLVIAAFMPIAMYHRARSATREKLDRWQEGPFILFGLRLGAVPLAVGIITWLIDPQWMAWAALPLPAWLRWPGVVLLTCWGLLLVWTFHTLGKNLTDTVVTRQEHTLVTNGPYQYVRHPFYVSFALAILGLCLATANWFIPLAGLVPLGFLVLRTRTEERKLVERFGDQYEEYMRRVGRFIPRFRR